MSKAVLVTEMPESCRECPAGNSMISNKADELCACELIFPFLGEVRCVDKYINSRPDWCPLRELPDRRPYNEEKITDKRTGQAIHETVALGWNAYRDAIVGEEYYSKKMVQNHFNNEG